ncbi:late competence protein ComER [Paenibacillus chungangensis]|uniref:Pyrroline-5-carboxylate reductase n=1 Tax=Paenibacillus chungangensis TaxID=696535 RepID=A0ABW3HM49_9BACL
MNVGFIGTGSMGSLLIEAFISSDALSPSEITISNRTIAKAEALADRYPGMNVAYSNAEAALNMDYIFLCIKPHEFKQVVQDIQSSVHSDSIVVSITSPVLLSHLERELNCKVAKIIPSITNMVRSGATLCMYGDSMTEQDKSDLEQLFSFISEPIRIEESYTRIVSDLSSCGPAFFAFLLQQFVDAAVEETGIPRDGALQVAINMLHGTGLLLTEGGMTLEQIQQRVAVPGGITAKALYMLRQETEGIFNHLIRTTHTKYKDDLVKVSNAFCGEEVNGQ